MDDGSSMMMPMMMMASFSMVAVAGAGYWWYTNQATTIPPTTSPPTVVDTPTPAPEVSGVSGGTTTGETMTPGEYVIRIGSQSLSTPTNCKYKVPKTRTQTTKERSTWKLTQAGSDASGPYYTIQSQNRSFNKICKDQYLQAEFSTCKTSPILGPARSGDPRQFWRLVQDGAGSGYMLQNVSCANGRSQSFLTFGGQKANQKASFFPRSGTAFTIEAPYSG